MLIAERGFESVVIGVGDSTVRRVLSIVFAGRADSSSCVLPGSRSVDGLYAVGGVRRILAERSAACEAQAERGVSWIRRDHGKYMMSLITHVANGEHGIARDLPLKGEHVIVDVRRPVTMVEERIGSKWHEISSVEGSVRIRARDTV